ncbi:MAG: hypothetical protein JNN00_03160 [Chitinophagaceae bacterium]|nr:hypothetical protein [Chitinophagaceae bacterium]
MAKPCLIIVFNHRYDKNIPILRKIYSPRFSHIFFLVPFYNGTDPDVIPVYESSNFFQSYFAQGYYRFFHENFSHYIFTGDDCLLNPAVNENNFPEQLGLSEKTDLISGFIELHTLTGRPWWHAHKAIDFFNNRKGAEIKKELPSREEAVERFKHHGIDVVPLTPANIFGTQTPPDKKWWQYWLFKQYHLQYKWKAFKKNGKIELPYPVAGSYSDVLIVTKESIYDFCRYCGMMAAAGLFVELAIPTALLLSSQKIIQEKDLRLQGKALWSAGEVEEVEKRFDKSLTALLAGFPAGQLYYHPVKLSKWKNDL